MARFGSIAALPRVDLKDIPASQSVKIVPDGVSAGNRDIYRWAIDTYNTFTVGVFLPRGETLPADGITLYAENFSMDMGTDKARKGRTVAVYEDKTVTNGLAAREERHLTIYIETSSEYDFESITIHHA